MRLHRLLSGLLVAGVVGAGLGTATLQADQTSTPTAATPAAPAAKAASFATLKGIAAVPMAAKELDAVKGQHVHFLDAGGGKVHLAGDVKTENNWQNIGGSDGLPVAPSYYGLCVAAGYSGPAAGNIAIPGGQFQCPL